MECRWSTSLNSVDPADPARAPGSAWRAADSADAARMPGSAQRAADIADPALAPGSARRAADSADAARAPGSAQRAGGGPPDIFAAAGVEMPPHLRTSRRRWISLSAVTVLNAVASGPLQSWPTLEPLLVKTRVWEGADQIGKLQGVFSFALGVAMISGLLNGVLFDVMGPRWVLTVGSFGLFVCHLVMAAAVQNPGWNDHIWWCYPLLSFFAWLSMSGCFAWLWLLPESQSMVSGVITSMQSLSGTLVVLAVWANSALGLSLPAFLLLVSFMAALSGGVSLALVPGIDDLRKYKAVVCELSQAEAGSDDGYDEAPAFPEEEGTTTPVSRAILESAAVSVLMHPTATCLFTLYMQAVYMWFVYPNIDMYGFYRGMFSKADAKRLVDYYGVIFGSLGAMSGIMAGAVVDRVGFERSARGVNIFILVGSILLCTRSFFAQVAAQIILSLLSGMWMILLQRFCIHYVPVDLFGTWNGSLQSVLGLGQLVLTPSTSLFASWVRPCLQDMGIPGMIGNAGTCKVAVGFLYFWTSVFSSCYLIHLRKHPMPPASSLRLSDVHAAIDSAVWSGETGCIWG